VTSFPKEFPSVSAADKGLKAEKAVFEAVRSAAEELSQMSGNKKLQFLLFHSVKYGIAGSGPFAKWESDVDIVLLCFDTATG
jgi:hypothetical protein